MLDDKTYFSKKGVETIKDKELFDENEANAEYLENTNLMEEQNDKLFEPCEHDDTSEKLNTLLSTNENEIIPVDSTESLLNILQTKPFSMIKRKPNKVVKW